MGAKHAMSCYLRWGHLGHPQVRLLVRMALTAKDSDDAPVFYGGRAMLAEGMGLPDTPSTHRRIRRWVADLVEAGAVEVVEVGRNGRRSTYRLHPLDLPAPSADPLLAAIRDGFGGTVVDFPKAAGGL